MRTVSILTIFFIFTLPLQAQFLPGRVELQLFGTVGSVSESSTYVSPSGEEETHDDESMSYAYIALTPGYYLFRGVSVELELGLRAAEGGPPAQIALANLSYSHSFPTSPIALFARAGGGLANGVSIPNYLDLLYQTDGFDVTVLQAGAGIKIRTGRSGIIRVEINYRNQQYDRDLLFGSSEHSLSTIALLLGVGVLL
ncbi:MAG: hypothetical protein RRA94_00460 [Bacteroidota bacterium]|nr:hypothetical protein [Bacteroidota bacterium]